ncbi:hypothetical protein C0991_010106 [Blastosporella zonata]|nr:hypothetical protein C0991_000560 [Blastosporella zonata]KAG6839950.1 hypothetical protein C0991_010106 [Blastosporella zonata]
MPHTSSPPTRDFLDAKWDEINLVLKAELDHHSPVWHITSIEEFNVKVTLLMSIIQETINNDGLVLSRKPSPFSRRWWNTDLTDLKKELRKANREAACFSNVWDHSFKVTLKHLNNRMD